MSVSVFNEIKAGLNEAIEFEKGNLKANTRTLSVTPIEVFTASEIKDIRNTAGMTQALFAKYLGVSLKTVEAWEAGRNQPSGAACRMLAITKRDPLF
ncbi:MAG: helix-turn-helix domain-containing protein, partial [Clostridia bacterium]|nr:helix-turn-helix domain-containing protein [Clostridia bacterium]